MHIDRTENNSLVTVLAVVLVCILVFLALIMAVVVVICLIFKKKGKRKRKLPEHVYDSVSPPPNTHPSLSEATSLDYDEVKTTSDSTATQFELTDNVAYNSFKPPPAAAETNPSTGSTVADL